jgi:paraquat-inducible protein B
MSDTDSSPPPSDSAAAEVAFKKRRGISIVWVIPIVAAAVAGWLVYANFANKGPTVTISFKTGEGLEAGKTKVKFKEIEAGEVTEIDVSDDLSTITVTAELAKELEPHLGEKTRFWVVKPELTASGISGLGTLVSGSYIEVDPVSGPPQRNFVGLEVAPIVRSDVPGREYVLTTDKLGSIARGSQVSYRGLSVGEVLDYALTDDNRAIEIRVFIQDPYSDFVRPKTRFWNTSGVRARLDANGIDIAIESVAALLAGGIAFETTPIAMEDEPSSEGSKFVLFESLEIEKEELITISHPILLHFDGSVRGLSEGAPMEFRGIRIGTVTDVYLRSDPERAETQIEVVAAFEPERIHGLERDPDSRDPYGTLDKFIKKGLRARLEQGSLITGQLYISLDFYEDAEPAELIMGGIYPRMPTVPTEIEEIKRSVNDVLKNIAALPLEEIADDLRLTLQSVNGLVGSPEAKRTVVSLDKTLQDLSDIIGKLDQEAGPLIASLRQTSDAAGETVKQAQATLESADQLIGSDSEARHNLVNLLSELADAARSIRVLADYLERHPEALIQGKGR